MGRHNTHILNHYHYGHYRGDEEEGTPSSNEVNVAEEAKTTQNYLREYGPAIYDYFQGKTAEEQAAIYRVQIRNLEEMKRATPALASVYDMRIDRLEGLLAAVEGQVYSEKETRFFATVYKLGGLVFVVGVPLAVIYYLVSKAD